MSTDPDARERLRQFFLTTPDTSISTRWDDLWKTSFIPFDRGTANPALDEALATHLSASSSTPSLSTPLPSPICATTGRRRTALVPGCGRGYDVLLLAAYGFDAVGLEISPTAKRAAEDLRALVDAALHPDAPASDAADDRVRDIKRVYATRDQAVGRGTARFVLGDFFGDVALWDEGATQPDAPQLPRAFDLVADYTFLCAFPHSQRPRWAKAVTGLMADDEQARLLCVEFPTYKEPDVRGPPWPMPTTAYLAVLAWPGKEVEYDEGMRPVIADQDVATLESGRPLGPGGMVRLLHYRAARTHEIGKGTDHVGVWRKSREVDGAWV